MPPATLRSFFLLLPATGKTNQTFETLRSLVFHNYSFRAVYHINTTSRYSNALDLSRQAYSSASSEGSSRNLRSHRLSPAPYSFFDFLCLGVDSLARAAGSKPLSEPRLCTVVLSTRGEASQYAVVAWQQQCACTVGGCNAGSVIDVERSIRGCLGKAVPRGRPWGRPRRSSGLRVQASASSSPQ